MADQRGVFITVEGVEGCGKSTQLRMLAERLTADGHRVVLTREPGGCPIADQIRAILLDAANAALVPTAELLLYAAGRAQHIQEVILPALAAGMVVLCDRFFDSTTAYQGYGRGLDRKLLRRLRLIATSGLNPDATILYDLPPEIGVRRSMVRLQATLGPDESRFEREAIAFHQRVRKGFLQTARQEPERFVVVNGLDGNRERTVEELHEETYGQAVRIIQTKAGIPA